MPHRLSLSRAARLAGVSRAVLQSKISKGLLPTFEGEVTPEHLLEVFPDIDLETNTELDRVTKIKDDAFGKRIRERVLPDSEILISRLRVATSSHAILKMEMARIKKIIENLDVLFKNKNDQEIPGEILTSIKNYLLEEIYNADVDNELAPIMAKDELLNIMTGHVTLLPGGKDFFVSGNDSILEAALGAGINLNWGCSNGNCGLCKGKILSGKTEKISHHDFKLKESEKTNGTILMCCHTPITNIKIEAEELGLETIPKQKVKCKVKNINQIDAEIFELVLQTPRSKRLRFLAGQTVSLTTSDASSKKIQRTLPIASCPCDDRNIQFHIRQDDTDEFSKYLENEIETGDSIIIKGPDGSFNYDDNATGAALFIASGTGFAPIQGLIEHAMAVDNAPTIELLRIQDSPDSPYLDNRCRSWADALDELSYDVVADHDAANLKIKNLCETIQPTQIFIAGPKTCVEALQNNQALSSQNMKSLVIATSGYIEPD